jgi:predicted DsbA family dithiol-disulfide isomerase
MAAILAMMMNLPKSPMKTDFTIDPASLADPALDRQIANDIEMSRQLRVDGVPFMIFAGQYAIAGAHLPEHLIPAIDGCLVKPAE